jgi:hypothetical protein
VASLLGVAWPVGVACLLGVAWQVGVAGVLHDSREWHDISIWQEQ